jgi:hypothetical protein
VFEDFGISKYMNRSHSVLEVTEFTKYLSKDQRLWLRVQRPSPECKHLREKHVVLLMYLESTLNHGCGELTWGTASRMKMYEPGMHATAWDGSSARGGPLVTR